MWVVGVIVVMAAGLVAILTIGWEPRTVPSPPLWRIPELSGLYIGIVATIAGFSVASAIFIASVEFARKAPQFATVIGMLLLAFLILVFSALIYASIPNVRGSEDAITERLSLILANMCGCMGLSVSWLALIPLLELIELPALAIAFTWVLLTVTLAASGWSAIFAYRLTVASARACLALPLLGIALPAVYRLVAVRLWPSLWPASDAALRLSFIALGVAGLLFSLHMVLLLAHGHHDGRRRLHRDGHRLALAATQIYAIAVALTWFAIALP